MESLRRLASGLVLRDPVLEVAIGLFERSRAWWTQFRFQSKQLQKDINLEGLHKSNIYGIRNYKESLVFIGSRAFAMLSIEILIGFKRLLKSKNFFKIRKL
ncbi:unnamed protein product [Allacma fusca]|uniref:Uncharacterized protein n=1 Tax=Allacma fusca TaxID=39272 RepID=A0A8J2P8E8_9HEXA|nr:unnamed protein product [Allacma fusca]